MRFRINKPDVVHEIIEGEAVIVNFDNGNYYSLDDIGVEIWGFIENDADLADIVENLANQYGGDRTDIENGAHQFLTDLEKEGLIAKVEEDGNKTRARETGETESKPNQEKSLFKAPALQKYTDMQEMLLLDPIHEVDESGWPNVKTDIPRNKE